MYTPYDSLRGKKRLVFLQIMDRLQTYSVTAGQNHGYVMAVRRHVKLTTGIYNETVKYLPKMQWRIQYGSELPVVKVIKHRVNSDPARITTKCFLSLDIVQRGKWINPRCFRLHREVSIICFILASSEFGLQVEAGEGAEKNKTQKGHIDIQSICLQHIPSAIPCSRQWGYRRKKKSQPQSLPSQSLYSITRHL